MRWDVRTDWRPAFAQEVLWCLIETMRCEGPVKQATAAAMAAMISGAMGSSCVTGAGAGAGGLAGAVGATCASRMIDGAEAIGAAGAAGLVTSDLMPLKNAWTMAATPMRCSIKAGTAGIP